MHCLQHPSSDLQWTGTYWLCLDAMHTATGGPFPCPPQATTERTHLDVTSEEIARIALYEPDGLEQWQRLMHSRCNGTTIRCPWCPDEPKP